MNDLIKKGIAEFIGTFFLVVFGVGTAILTGNVVATALAFGLVLLVLYYTIGKISGCHINPAVTVAMLINKSIKVVPAIVYICVQVLAGIAGAFFLKYAFKPIQNNVEKQYNSLASVYQIDNLDLMRQTYLANGYTAEQVETIIDDSVSSVKKNMNINPDNFTNFGTNASVEDSINGKITSLIIEVFLTFAFVLVVCKVSSDSDYSRIGGLAVGMALALVHLLGIGLTGTSVNPARSIGPAILVGGEALKNVWIFIVGPIIGGVLASIVSKFVLSNEDKKEEKDETVKA